MICKLSKRMAPACLVLVSINSSAAMLTFNSATNGASDVANVRNSWLLASNITTPQYLVDFESGFTLGENISGLGLFPGGLVISDTSSNQALIKGAGGFGSSNPIGSFAVWQNEGRYLELDFSSSPIDYLSFRDIDHVSTAIIVTFVGGATESFSIETTAFSGNSAEFAGIFRNDMPQITRIQLDAAGDGSWGIDNIEYGVSSVPVPAAVWLFGSGLLGLIGIARRRHS